MSAQFLRISRHKQQLQPARRPFNPERLHARRTPAATGLGRPPAPPQTRRPLPCVCAMRARDMRPVALGLHTTPIYIPALLFCVQPTEPQRQPSVSPRRGAQCMQRTLGLRVRRRPGGAAPEPSGGRRRPTGAGLFRGVPKYSSRGTPPLATSVRAAARRLAGPVLQLRAPCRCGGARAEASPPRRAPPRTPLSRQSSTPQQAQDQRLGSTEHRVHRKKKVGKTKPCAVPIDMMSYD